MNDFLGKYRGKVTGNRDPMNLGRIQVEVPAVLGSGRGNWAMPCVPYAGPQVGFYAMPPLGANVWVEFEGGDPNYPIWSGCFWGNEELPASPAAPETKVFKIEGITLTLSSLEGQGGLTIELTNPAVKQPLTLKMDDNGIELNNNKQTVVKLTTEEIQLSDGEKTLVKLSVDAIQLSSDPLQVTVSSRDSKIELSNGASTATLTTGSIEIKQGAATVKLGEGGIELTFNPASVKLSPSGVEASSAPARLSVAPAAIALSNGLGDIQVAPAGVNINSGALEIT